MTRAIGVDNAPTSGGLPIAQAITVNCGGKTPKGVIIKVTRKAGAGGNEDGAMVSVGASDGTNVRCAAAMAEDGQLAASTDTGHQRSNAAIILILATTTEAVIASANFVSFAADTVNISWTVGPPSTDYLISCEVFFGDDCECFVGQYSGSTSLHGTATISGIAFRPRGGEFLHAQNSFTAAGAAAAKFGRGFCAWDEAGGVVGQACISYASADRPATTACTLLADSGNIAIRLGISVAGVTQAAVHRVASGTSDGFVVETVAPGTPASPSALVVGFLVFRYGLRRTWVGQATSPTPLDATSVSLQAFTDPGFDVAALSCLAVSHAAIGDYARKSASWSDGLAVVPQVGGVDPASAAIGFQEENNAVTGDTRCRIGGTFIHVLDDAGGVDWSADCAPPGDFTSGGFQLDVTSAAAGARVAFFLAIETDTVIGSGQLRLKAPSLSGVGTVTITGFGQLRVAAPDFLGSGSETISGSGQIRASAPDFLGSGAEIMAGSGQLRVAAPDFNGTGQETISGSGQLRVAAPDFAGSGSLTITGSGQIRVEAPDFNGSGAEIMSGSGQLRVEAPSFDGTGEFIISGSGQLRVEAPSFDGTGALTITGSGQLRVEAADFNGVGSQESNPTGAGQIRVSAPRFTGSGIVLIIEIDIGCTEDFAASYDQVVDLPASYQTIVEFGGSYDQLVELSASHDLVVDLAGSYDEVADFPGSIC